MRAVPSSQPTMMSPLALGKRGKEKKGSVTSSDTAEHTPRIDQSRPLRPRTAQRCSRRRRRAGRCSGWARTCLPPRFSGSCLRHTTQNGSCLEPRTHCRQRPVESKEGVARSRDERRHGRTSPPRQDGDDRQRTEWPWKMERQSPSNVQSRTVVSLDPETNVVSVSVAWRWVNEIRVRRAKGVFQKGHA